MAHFPMFKFLLILCAHAHPILSLGINCRGSALCPRATWNNDVPESIIQLLRDAIYDAPEPLSTAYQSGDHVICVSQSQPITISPGFAIGGITGSIGLSGSIPEGGICLFPENMASGASLTLATIRPLLDAVLEHGCTTCGSVPIHFVDEGSNDPSDGILTFDYVANPFCIDNCISAVGGSESDGASTTKSEVVTVTTSESASIQTAAEVVTVTASELASIQTAAEVVTVTASESASIQTAVQAATSSQEDISTSTGLTTSVLPSAASPSDPTNSGSKLHLSLSTLSLWAAVLSFLVFAVSS
ncbi:killer toxin [Penicillium longicatenatum]|uniref:killer toxin n=1 Tax=Penicillium longicatenatum TaxID=1561947 RepID=UPI002546ECEC|nr:killer toxin [Penicillium longicatenatum]KAJ5631707.1 killer toxin [Penicillium longicatenatum]